MDKVQGRVILARSGFYDFRRDQLTLRCTLRGRIKREQRSERGRRIYADRVIVIMSTHLPYLNFRFLDRFLILAESREMENSPFL